MSKKSFFKLFFLMMNLSGLQLAVADVSQPLFQHQDSFKQTNPTPTQPPPQPSHLPKKILPIMDKPFGMPGVIGYQNNTWQGTDYLGYLSNNIGINVEILKGENTPQGPDAGALQKVVSEIFTKANINPHAQVVEGPPLPFLHVLIIIYPVDKDKFAIFGASRLFEQIGVMRKNFTPAGYWQGITWENQDVVLADGKQLNEQITHLVEKLATAFSQRYQAYNANLNNGNSQFNPAFIQSK